MRLSGLIRKASLIDILKQLEPGMKISISTSLSADPALIVKEIGDHTNVPPYNKGVMLERYVQSSAVSWIYPEGSKLMWEPVNGYPKDWDKTQVKSIKIVER